ncbi:ADP-ribose 1''-phosphate phosphatase [Fusarium sp. LHS14.1]|nr:ADP-ribose 1''-phosphate phosphatase [Fusarium sp. LHS14.1]
MLDETLLHLFADAEENGSSWSDAGYLQHYQQHLSHLGTGSKLSLLQEILCVRSPVPPLPEDILQKIDSILLRTRDHRVLIQASSLIPSRTISHEQGGATNLVLWRGDITTLTGITAITNAANGQILGCFQPTHRCIDNIIHSRAGPRLRDECFQLMQDRDKDLGAGETLVTRGYDLPSSYVIHTVGPQLRRGASPTEVERRQLARCYESTLDALELLPAEEDGRKAIALCCISTGLFAFPAKEAAEIAILTVLSWLDNHPSTTITDIIFNTFTESDTEIYSKLFEALPEDQTPRSDEPKLTPLVGSLALAREWLDDADAVLVTAGAGLSATEGLDYHSRSLFAENFPGFLKYGLTSLYSVFGYSDWPSEEHRWGYFFTHLNMVSKWPKMPSYQALISRLTKFGPDAHVRTSNADGMFLANGWSEKQLSTPQGSYAYLQCLENCRVEATVRSAPLVADAIPHLDKVTQKLTDSSKVPQCKYCGAKMNICVRAGPWFNQAPFKDGEVAWKAWKSRILREKKKLVILELGVGMNTPGVLRWPNEDLVSRGNGLVKLVRVGLGPEAVVSWDQEDGELSTYVDGDISQIMPLLVGDA